MGVAWWLSDVKQKRSHKLEVDAAVRKAQREIIAEYDEIERAKSTSVLLGAPVPKGWGQQSN